MSKVELDKIEEYMLERAQETDITTSSDVEGFSLGKWLRQKFAELRARQASIDLHNAHKDIKA